MESIAKLGKRVGESGANALYMAQEDLDTFVSWNAGVAYDALGIAKTEEGFCKRIWGWWPSNKLC